LEERCPNVLLIDETFAPLDPDSKSLVMQKLKEFCSESIVFVIYHADVQVTEGSEESEEQTCVESSNFFDANLHVEDGSMGLRSVCSS
jgi:ABC-type Mn2+/Zn2+ transport system ATPase subunit